MKRNEFASSIYWINLLANDRHPSKSSRFTISAIWNYAQIDDNMELYMYAHAATKEQKKKTTKPNTIRKQKLLLH